MLELLTAIAATCSAIETGCTPFECETEAALADCLAVSASRLAASQPFEAFRAIQDDMAADMAALPEHTGTACTGAIRAQGGCTVARNVPAILEAQRAGRVADLDLYLETVQATLQAKRNGALPRTVVALWDASTVAEPLWVVDSAFTHCYQGAL
jgi:hypothetical protein